MKRALLVHWFLACSCLLPAGTAAASQNNSNARPAAKPQSPATVQRAEALVRDHPNFQLAQLVYGDLLASQARPLRAVGDVSDADARTGAQMLAELREESQLRIRALPINYPNPYDLRRGKTGGGIWLHGSPPAQFSRAPKATDGCVVLANPDLQRIISTMEIRTTPVVIAQTLNWVPPQSVQPDSRRFADALKELSYLRWTDNTDTMVVTFDEVVAGTARGPVKRQYWVRQGALWKIFFEGVIG